MKKTKDRREYVLNEGDEALLGDVHCCKCGTFLTGKRVYAKRTWRTSVMPASAHAYHCDGCAPKGTRMALQDQHRLAGLVAGRSHGLWRSTNMVIAAVIAKGIKHRHPRGRIADRLDRLAGPETKGEPMCLSNYREAARAVREADLMYLT